MNKKFVVHARVLKAMSDENRLRILDLLREREYNASELLDEMDFGQSTLSHHMRILLQAGAVKARKNGKWTYYSLNKEIFSTVSEWIAEYGDKYFAFFMNFYSFHIDKKHFIQ